MIVQIGTIDLISSKVVSLFVLVILTSRSSSVATSTTPVWKDADDDDTNLEFRSHSVFLGSTPAQRELIFDCFDDHIEWVDPFELFGEEDAFDMH
ncbi:hypothetical protein H0H92_011069, partial [Tricholoma furcatifolium]